MFKTTVVTFMQTLYFGIQSKNAKNILVFMVSVFQLREIPDLLKSIHLEVTVNVNLDGLEKTTAANV